MDIAFNQHSPHARHTNRSSTNLSHLTLAPLTSRLPLSDPDELPGTHHVSYFEGRSAPTTPSILSRSSSRVSLKRPAHITLPKSKSSTQLLASKQPRSAAVTPGGTKPRSTIAKDELNLSVLSSRDQNDSDWLLRAGASISSSTRESKGQAWLVSRASSTSLTAERDDDREYVERSLSGDREPASKRGSRRGSRAGAFDGDDEFSPVTTRRSLSFGPPTGPRSRPASHYGSRSTSRRGSRAQIFTPKGGEREGYFDTRDLHEDGLVAEPDFVDVEEDGYENEDDVKEDEAVVRKLARASSNGLGGWVERMLGWHLFAVDEDGEDGEDGEETEVETSDETTGSETNSTIHKLHPDGAEDPTITDMPPLKDGETGGWQDAAWLLSVATKVLL